jgi:hypothetical protein
MSVALRHRQEGQVVALAGVAMLAIAGMIVLVFSIGMFLLTRRDLQKAADAAALAGIMDWQDGSVADATQAHDDATNYARLNAFCQQQVTPVFDALPSQQPFFGSVDLPGSAPNTLAPSLHLKVPCQVLGVTLQAEATAAKGCIDPISHNVINYDPVACPTQFSYGARLVQ